MQLLSDVTSLLTEYSDISIHIHMPATKANRLKFISEKIVFVPNSLVRNVVMLLK